LFGFSNGVIILFRLVVLIRLLSNSCQICLLFRDLSILGVLCLGIFEFFSFLGLQFRLVFIELAESFGILFDINYWNIFVYIEIASIVG